MISLTAEFFHLVDNILNKANKGRLLTALNEDRSKLKVENEFNNLDSVFKDVKEVLKNKAYDKVAEFALNTVI